MLCLTCGKRREGVTLGLKWQKPQALDELLTWTRISGSVNRRKEGSFLFIYVVVMNHDCDLNFALNYVLSALTLMC